MVINNGLAPPNPDNVLDNGTFTNDGVFVRNMGCGDSLAYSSCPSPEDPTDSEIVDGGRADTFYALDTSTITMRGGRVTRQMQAMDGGHITVVGGTIGGYLGALENSTVSLYSGNVDGFLHVDHLSVLSWYGGSVGGRLQAGGNSVLNVYGHGFRVDGTRYPQDPSRTSGSEYSPAHWLRVSRSTTRSSTEPPVSARTREPSCSIPSPR
jgi:hypothetical protein